MKILGLSCYYHDAAACLIVDGQIVAAAAEERFTRSKHDNTFPINAIEYCLDTGRLAANDLDLIVFYEKPILKFERIMNQYLAHFPKVYKTFTDTAGSWMNVKLKIKDTIRDQLHYYGKIEFVQHHVAHAASSYYLSGFDDAVILTLDGVGEWATTTLGMGKQNTLRIDQEIQFPHSLGLLYSAMTSFLGFSVNDAEYKVMGLAAYGNPRPYRKHFRQLIQFLPDGSYQLNMNYFTFDWADRMYDKNRLASLFGIQPRVPETPAERPYQDIAAALQEVLEEAVWNLLRSAQKKYKTKNLCLAGGVALNSVMNGKICKKTSFRKIFIPPDPGDAGGAMGAALWAQCRYAPNSRKQLAKDFTPYLGPSFSWHAIEAALQKHQLSYQFIPKRDQLLETVCSWIVDQKIIGWFQGRMEWGPRALGARSILASAATVEMRDIINEKVKHRELFRPFAPVILEEHTTKYFESDEWLSPSARYMLMVYPFKPIGRVHVPAVYHVDGTGRLQTLHRRDNPLYYDLIERHRQQTGVPIIINTSFNVRGEPIVCTPEDAIQCFLNTDIDYLVIDSFLVSKHPLRNKKTLLKKFAPKK
jgi:carbamoyltransferase